MHRVLLMIICVVSLTLSVSGAVSYDIQTEDTAASINSTLDVYAEQDVNQFRTRWTIPERATIHRIEDTHGEIDEWERNGDRVQITSNKGSARRQETISIEYTIPAVVESWQNSVYRLELSLPGFSDKFEEYDEEETQIRVRTDEPVLGVGPPTSFDYSLEDQEAILAGEGPATFRLTYTNETSQQYNHYTAIGAINLTQVDETYPLLWHITGFEPQFTRSFAVISLEPSTYNERMDRWSGATYRQGGLIFLRNKTRSPAELTSLMMHETMHGFNQEKLGWVQLDTGVFDEGTAQYAEWITKKRQNQRYGELFGDNVTWNAPCNDNPDRNCEYWLTPRGGTPSTLWNYYEQDQTFMQGWSPTNAGTRSFGYAFSELIIRDYMLDKDPSALHTIYDELDEFDRVETEEAYWTKLKSVFDNDVNPCERSSIEETTQCTDRINDTSPQVPDEVSIEGESSANLTFNPVEREQVSQTNQSTQRKISNDLSPFFQGLKDWVRGRITRLMNIFEK